MKVRGVLTSQRSDPDTSYTYTFVYFFNHVVLFVLRIKVLCGCQNYFSVTVQRVAAGCRSRGATPQTLTLLLNFSSSYSYYFRNMLYSLGN